MGNIVLLDDLTINKIAAGEVIERPASVVKEMVENSIDAESKNITIEIKNGGISFIKITDDGSGISEDDMEIAFERHATSKIRSALDLETVTTMGFRGEALASIAAISNVEMISKKQGEEIGHKIVVEGGKVIEKLEVGCPVGTSITVRNLFFNTPVRYKFLKKDYTEAGYIEDAVKRIALVNKDVSIKFINTGKTIIHTNGSGNLKNIIYSIYGKDIANSVKNVDYQYEDIKVTGVIGQPNIARANRQNQLFFVNGRYVKDKNLTIAVDQSYKDIIPAGKFGFVVLNLEMNPQKLDVNVHPAKLEVRFEDENQIFKAIYHSIKNALGNDEKTDNIQEPKMEVNNNIQTIEPKLENNKDLTIQERINIINEMIGKISPQKPLENFNNEEKVDVSNKKNSETTSNLIEEIYKSRLSKSDIPKIKTDYDEEGRTIKYGNTRISSNTQEINVIAINEKLSQEYKKEEINLEKNENQDENINPEESVIITEKNEIAGVTDNIDSQFEETLKVTSLEGEETNKLLENETQIQGDKEEIFKENKDEFVTKVADKLIESKLNEVNTTEMIDTNKVKKAITETFEKNPEFEKMYEKTFGVEMNSTKEKEEDVKLESEKFDLEDAEYVSDINQSLFEAMEEYNQINYKLIGVAFSNYIIIEIRDEMYMIDEQAAQERVLYEQIKKDYYGKNDSQWLLIPDIITLKNKQMDIAKENYEMFKKAGFEFEEFGDNTIKLSLVPSICENMNTKKLFIELLEELNTVAVTEIEEKEAKFISTLAYRITENMKMELEIEEIEILLEQLLKLPNPFVSYGRKNVAIKMTKYDLDRKFSRR